ncbi:hypothetical protein [Umezawaea sp. NPDC059074]|uniref:hypothetical protein n=1 Tax=Umezawaea sp. NPDC059074 TaxID=3346716 RepID=UPI0036A0B740
MSDLEQELRAMADLAVPPATTGLHDVLRRGRRRVFALRAGAAAGVVAVIVGAGFTALTLRSAPTSLPPADGGPVVATTTPWPAVDLPVQHPDVTGTPPDGRSISSIPLCASSGIGVGAEVGNVPVAPAVAEAFGAAVDAVARPAVAGEQQTAELPPFRSGDGPRYARWIDVSDAAGTGSVAINQWAFGGEPLMAADRDGFFYGNCAPPNRLVLDDGTVVQHYSVTPGEPFQSLSQALRIYRPDGVLIEVVQRDHGTPDFRTNPNGTLVDHRAHGRATPPLSTEQLKAIGELVARAR